MIRNVLKATEKLKNNPEDEEARGVILYGASLATSGRLGLGKEGNYPYDIYELEFIPEVLFGVPYRKSLTTIFPRFLKAMAARHEEDIRAYFRDAFGFEGDAAQSADQLTALFERLGVDMYFDGELLEEEIGRIEVETVLGADEVFGIMKESMRL